MEANRQQVFDALQLLVKSVLTDEEREQLSDGYHSYKELYDHRIALWIVVCKRQVETLDFFYRNAKTEERRQQVKSTAPWRSKLHSDGTEWEGWFILGINQNAGQQITYHLPISEWENTDFGVVTLEKAPEWDGHDSAEALRRIKKYLL